MALTTEQMDRIMDEHLDYERRDDVEGVLATLTEDAVHDVIGWPPGPSRGHAEAREFYETLFADLGDSTVKTITRRYGKNFMVDESLWSGRATGAPFGLEGRGRPLSFRMLHVLEFSEAGRISREQVWLDLAAIFQQLADD